MKDYNVKDIIRSIIKDDLYLYKKRGSKANFNKVVLYDKKMRNKKTGSIFVSKTKDDLSRGKGYIITSYESLLDKSEMLSHWTPNTFTGGGYYDFKNRIIKGHTKKNLKQINVFGFDVDTKDIDIYALYLHCMDVDLPTPNLILETPKGYQFFFILETPFYVNRKNNYKSIRVAERVSENIRSSINKVMPIDYNCSPFGFFRVPNQDNIVYFNNNLINTQHLITWSKNYEREEQKKAFHVVYNNDSLESYTTSSWYRTLLKAKHIDKGYYASSRNNTLFTLALSNYADGIDFDIAHDVLDQWNSSLKNPLTYQEFKRTLKSAYSGRYNGVKKEYVNALLDNWSNSSDIKFQPKMNGWYKFAKPREKRKRSHNWEWVNDIKEFLKENTTVDIPFYQATFRELATITDIPLTSLKKALKSGKFVIKTIGKGRAAKTFFAEKNTLILHVIKIKNKKEPIQTTLETLLPTPLENTKSQAITREETYLFYLDTS